MACDRLERWSEAQPLGAASEVGELIPGEPGLVEQQLAASDDLVLKRHVETCPDCLAFLRADRCLSHGLSVWKATRSAAAAQAAGPDSPAAVETLVARLLAETATIATQVETAPQSQWPHWVRYRGALVALGLTVLLAIGVLSRQFGPWNNDLAQRDRTWPLRDGAPAEPDSSPAPTVAIDRATATSPQTVAVTAELADWVGSVTGSRTGLTDSAEVVLKSAVEVTTAPLTTATQPLSAGAPTTDLTSRAIAVVASSAANRSTNRPATVPPASGVGTEGSVDAHSTDDGPWSASVLRDVRGAFRFLAETMPTVGSEPMGI